MHTISETLCQQAEKRGRELGDRDGSSARALGMTPQSSCPLTFAQQQTDSTLYWHFGITAGELTAAIEARAVSAFMDGYRDGYTEAYADGYVFSLAS